MRVLVLGMCRTGTSSMVEALKILGYHPHHMRSVLADPSQIPYWEEAFQLNLLPESERPAHLRGAKPYGREEFDKLLSGCDAVTDAPSALFYKELTQAYPDAKVILTNRSYESWQRSMSNTIWKMLTWRGFILVRKLRFRFWGKFTNFVTVLFRAHNGGVYKDGETREAFEKHYAGVRAIVPKENLLEVGPKFEWGPLCEFLGHEVPEEPYPWVNDSNMLAATLYGAWMQAMTELALAVLVPTGMVTAGVVAWWYRAPQSLW